MLICNHVLIFYFYKDSTGFSIITRSIMMTLWKFLSATNPKNIFYTRYKIRGLPVDEELLKYLSPYDLYNAALLQYYYTYLL